MFFILIFTSTIFLSGCQSSELKVLEKTVSTIQLEKGNEKSRSIQDKEVIFGKPVYAKISIEYEPIEYYTKGDVYEEIIKILEKNDWVKDEWNIVPDYFSASLQQDQTILLATVFIHPEKNLVIVEFVNKKL